MGVVIKIGELFVNLGVKGQDKMMQALKGAKKGMSGIASSSLATKAAVLGTFYAMERMNRFAGNLGAGLGKFSKLTGMSAEQLQRYQYAGRQVNITNDQMEQSFKNIQQAVGDMKINKGNIEGAPLVDDTVGLDYDRLDDTVYVMQKLQQFANEFKGDITLANSAIRSFGVGDDIISGFRQMAFTSEKMKNAELISDKDISRLSKMNAQLSEIYYTLKIDMTKFLAGFSPELIKGLKEALREFRSITKEIMNSTNALEGMKAIVSGILAIINSIVKGFGHVVKGVGVLKGFFGKNDRGFMDSFLDFGVDMLKGTEATGRKFLTGSAADKSIIPRGIGQGANNTNTNTSVRNEINIQGDTNNPQGLANTIMEELNKTFDQMNLSEER